MKGIEHRDTEVKHPWTNGFVERMNRTLLDECFRVEGRKNWYMDIGLTPTVSQQGAAAAG